ncbi:MAG: TMEM165/GDT1 family protein [Planctomycetes bacterium]|nr:TMEM165/GDT1 family protein [Planctomycetota bacterium]
MDPRLFLTVFGSVFLAEIGDKTQLATLTFASQPDTSKWTVFWASSAALVVTAAIGVLAGGWISRVASPKTLSIAAGCAFMLIGAWTLVRALKS